MNPCAYCEEPTAMTLFIGQGVMRAVCKPCDRVREHNHPKIIERDGFTPHQNQPKKQPELTA